VLEGEDDLTLSAGETAVQKAAHLSITEKRECHHEVLSWVKGLFSNYEDRAFYYMNVRALPSPTR
jgi:hypothetical protein